MKKVIFVLFFATFFFSCDDKDKPTPEPELSGKVTGTYKINVLKIDGESYPLDRADIIVDFTKFSSEVVTGTMKTTIDGEAEPDEDLGNINLKNAGSTGVDLYEGTTKIGNVSKENVLSIYVDFEGTQFEMQGNKR